MPFTDRLPSGTASFVHEGTTHSAPYWEECCPALETFGGVAQASITVLYGDREKTSILDDRPVQGVARELLAGLVQAPSRRHG